MTDEQLLLVLLKYELWHMGGVPDMDVAQLHRVLRIARQHTVAALAAHSFIIGHSTTVNDGGNSLLRQSLVVSMLQEEQLHKSMFLRFAQQLQELAALFRINNIHYVVFKGYAVASHYPLPFLRTMGDIDFYVVPEDFGRVIELLEQEWNINIDRDDTEKHYSFDRCGIRFELHHRIETFGRQKAQKRFDSWIADIVRHNTAYIYVKGENLSVLPPLADVVVVFKHLFNHLLIEGVGLRQVVDLAVLLDTCKNDIDVRKLRYVLQSLGYIRAFDAMATVLSKYLSLTSAASYAEINVTSGHYADRLFSMIMESGNFGRRAYSHQADGWRKSMETAIRAFKHSLFVFRLIPMEMAAFIPKRIGISIRKHLKQS